MDTMMLEACVIIIGLNFFNGLGGCFQIQVHPRAKEFKDRYFSFSHVIELDKVDPKIREEIPFRHSHSW